MSGLLVASKLEPPLLQYFFSHKAPRQLEHEVVIICTKLGLNISCMHMIMSSCVCGFAKLYIFCKAVYVDLYLLHAYMCGIRYTPRIYVAKA